MSFLFMDESGDLGFNLNKRGTSKFFVVTLLYTRDKKPIEKTISKIYKTLSIRPRKGENTLHSFKESSAVRLLLLKSLSLKEFSIFIICIDKRNMRSMRQKEKSDLYNFLADMLIDTVIVKRLLNEKSTELIASRREKNRFLNDRFKQYMQNESGSRHGISIKVMIKYPREEKCLQAVDFISWSIFRKYEHGDASYYDLIKDKIKEEHNLLT